MFRKLSIPSFCAVLILALAAGDRALAKDPEPDIVRVQHILIGFKRTVTGKKLERSKAEARELAADLLARATADDADFDALVKEFTDDNYPGIYLLTNKGAPRVNRAQTRDEVQPFFGDVAFSLEVGAVGMAKYHGGLSKYGWHIIKRIE